MNGCLLRGDAELGINLNHIRKKTEIVLKSAYQRGLQIDSEILEDADMAGPLVFCLALGGALLLVCVCTASHPVLLPSLPLLLLSSLALCCSCIPECPNLQPRGTLSQCACSPPAIAAREGALRRNLRPRTTERGGDVRAAQLNE